MTLPKSSYQILAQAETLLIYGIFLLLTGVGQIAVTMGHRYVIERDKNAGEIDLRQLLPTSFAIYDMHLWFIYLSAAWVSFRFVTKSSERPRKVTGKCHLR
jgi:hypothetical protein